MKRFIIVILIIGLVLTLLLAATSSAAAQTTPTPEPPTHELVEIGTRHLKLDFNVSLGDMAVVIVGLFLCTIIFVYIVFRFVTTYLK